MIHVRYRDLDPDQRGRISNDQLIAACPSIRSAQLIKEGIDCFRRHEDEGDPNREYYVEGTQEALASFDQRVWWLFCNHYETGLEYESLLRNLQGTDLDTYRLPDGTIGLPQSTVHIFHTIKQ
jgi:hypothetical protein